MFIIWGKRETTIRKYTDHQQRCPHCKDFDLHVEVFGKYFHFYYIPFASFGPKSVSIRCNTCNDFVGDAALEKEYEKRTRTPFYYYSGLILVGLLILSLVMVSINGSRERKAWVNDPHTGDVYGLRIDQNDSVSYSFLRISRIQGDSVFVYHSNLEYSRYVNTMNKDDFFVKDDELLFFKNDLKNMLEKGDINVVKRDYEVTSVFNRIR